jgi:hypothetical protein
LELRTFEGAAGDGSDTSHDASAVRRSNVDFLVGDGTLKAINKAELWLSHGIGFRVVGVARRILRLCREYHDCKIAVVSTEMV